jgi:hypothetical protein
MTDTTSTSSYAIPLSRLLARLESSIGDEEKLGSLNEVELRKAAAVVPPTIVTNNRMLTMHGNW